MQVEARLRQLEGRELEGDAIMYTPGGPSKHDSGKPDGSLVAVTPVAYNADADVAMDEPAEEAPNGGTEKKKKKVRLVFCEHWLPPAAHLILIPISTCQLYGHLTTPVVRFFVKGQWLFVLQKKKSMEAANGDDDAAAATPKQDEDGEPKKKKKKRASLASSVGADAEDAAAPKKKKKKSKKAEDS